MKKQKLKRIFIIVVTLVIMNLLWNDWFFGMILTLVHAVVGSEGNLPHLLAVGIANLLVGSFSLFPLYKEMRDNGDSVGEYKVFTANAFLNALERDCIDKSPTAPFC